MKFFPEVVRGITIPKWPDDKSYCQVSGLEFRPTFVDVTNKEYGD